MKISFLSMAFLMIALQSCSFQQCHIDQEFKSSYFNKISKIQAYDDNLSKPGNFISTKDWMEFYDVTDYLSLLTDCDFQFSYGEPPMYKSKSDVLSDVRYLKKWYRKNKCGMTIQKADSIVEGKKLNSANKCVRKR